MRTLTVDGDSNSRAYSACMLAGGGEYFGLGTLPKKVCWISYLVRRVSGEAIDS